MPDFPLIAFSNFRSATNKQVGINNLLSELGVEILLGVETWERDDNKIFDLITTPGYKYYSIYRESKMGGGCAIIYNDKRFFVDRLEYIIVPEGIEAI